LHDKFIRKIVNLKINFVNSKALSTVQ
jgi:hypothetical protein